jgi:hypothetical protein
MTSQLRLTYLGPILVIFILFSGCQAADNASDKSNLTGIARILASAAQTIDVYRNILTDPGVFWRFIEAQVYRAKIGDLVPTTPLLMLSPALDQYKMALCPRADVNKCMYYGVAPSKDIMGSSFFFFEFWLHTKLLIFTCKCGTGRQLCESPIVVCPGHPFSSIV